jgi:hypothetical protein
VQVRDSPESENSHAGVVAFRRALEPAHEGERTHGVSGSRVGKGLQNVIV